MFKDLFILFMLSEVEYQNIVDVNVVEIFDCEDLFELFLYWLEDVKKKEFNDVNVMVLVIVDQDGLFDVCMVFLKGVDECGFIFYINLESVKGQ